MTIPREQGSKGCGSKISEPPSTCPTDLNGGLRGPSTRTHQNSTCFNMKKTPYVTKVDKRKVEYEKTMAAYNKKQVIMVGMMILTNPSLR
ncbi:hypothetical protein L1987_20278 [Smallanthus sonchifolius]|uniref:Uncharacterized protein n=1 Tax=Smallanthus sonchifolius TaxID=185202 RepID=A0ACB9IT25_9ASTR|nr:hypothetical protein L1987_20278 [Smallanthus sonchifolius]